ncbi:MAG: hypothetical protein WC866_03910 [Patescibacteria group bacterium]|jgi:hypothetical protein
MRAWILSAFVLAGCLRGPAPVSTPDRAESLRYQAHDDWREYFLGGNYELAAMAATQGRLDPMLVGLALREARKVAKKSLKAFVDGDDYEARVKLWKIAWQAYREEVAIACLYGPTSASISLAVEDVTRASDVAESSELLYLLLDYECPLGREQRYEIITTAANDDKNEYALEMALRSNWNVIDKLEFVGLYIESGNCSFGLKAASRLGVDVDYLAQSLKDSTCESERLDSSGWGFSQAEYRTLFFETVRHRRYHLAFEFNTLGHGGEDGIRYLVQQLFAQHDEYGLEKLCVMRPSLRDAAYSYAIAHGRARFVGMSSKEIIWQDRAFEKLLEEGKFDDAAEVAEFGASETLRTEGVLKAFRAAVIAGNMVDARYLWKRYPKIVPAKEYKKAERAWIKAHPEDERFSRSRRMPRKAQSSECVASDPDDWTVTKCDK